MADGPCNIVIRIPSLQSLCVIKLIEKKSEKKLAKIKAPVLVIDELKLIKDKIAKQSYKSDYLANLENLECAED